MAATSALVLEQQLNAARLEIASLRKLTEYTLAIILASGGRIELTNQQVADGERASWRSENDGSRFVFEAWKS